jgi:hypothetical protein
MSDAAEFMAGLHAQANAAAAEETAWRQEAARRGELLERARAHAFRRWNVLRELSAAMQGDAEDREAAVARGLAQVRQRLGWPDVPDASRQAVLEALRPVAEALLGNGEPQEAVAAFETWFETRTGASFWALLDQPVYDTPVVDF